MVAAAVAAAADGSLVACSMNGNTRLRCGSLMLTLCAVICIFLSPTMLAGPNPANTDDAFASQADWQQKQEPQNFRDFRKQFLVYFNAKDRRPWPPLLSSKLRNPSKIVAFLKFVHREHGDIDSLRFKYFDRRKQRKDAVWLAVYLAEFSNGDLMEFRFGVDADKLLEKLIFTDPNYNEALPVLTSKTPLRLPFGNGEDWYVLWGGLTEDMNYHVTSRSQRNAIDLLIRHTDSQSSHRGEGKQNEDYYAFGKSVLAPADGTVIEVIDGVRDNVPGEMDPGHLTGNTIVIKTDHDEYLLLAHLKQGSVTVSEGQKVNSGQALASVGNSGHSSEPHLHMQLMDAAKMPDATGIRMRFDRLLLNHEARVWNYAPIRTNVISYPAQ